MNTDTTESDGVTIGGLKMHLRDSPVAEASIAVLRPQPGDTLVLCHPQHLTQVQRDAIRKQVESFIPEGMKVAVLDGGATLAHVVAPADK